VLANLAQWGLPAFVQDEAAFQSNLRRHVPDTFGMTQEEIEAMSPHTRSFVCQGQVEEGDPYCGDEKFDTAACPDRRFRTSWHPGWKWHAYQGNLMAVFVVEAAERAVDMLRERVAHQEDFDFGLALLLDQLVDSERADYQSVMGNVSATLPPYANRYHRPQRDGVDDDDAAVRGAANDDDDDNHWLRQLYYTAPNYCHIALLPSEIRYRGILDEHPAPPIFEFDRSNHSGRPFGAAAHLDPVDFEPALVLNPWEAFRNEEYAAASRSRGGDDDEMLLLGDPDTRQIDCPVPLNVDHQDYFFVSQPDGWRHVDLPNGFEVEAYGNGSSSGSLLKGVVAICYVGCPWGKCLETDKRWQHQQQLGDVDHNNNDNNSSVVDLQVNGVDVTNLREIDAHSDCHVLGHANGFVWAPRQQVSRMRRLRRCRRRRPRGSFGSAPA
jgi:hypothetical protein